MDNVAEIPKTHETNLRSSTFSPFLVMGSNLHGEFGTKII